MNSEYLVEAFVSFLPIVLYIIFGTIIIWLSKFPSTIYRFFRSKNAITADSALNLEGELTDVILNKVAYIRKTPEGKYWYDMKKHFQFSAVLIISLIVGLVIFCGCLFSYIFFPIFFC